MPRYPKYDGKTPLTRGVMNDLTRQLQGADRLATVLHAGSRQMDLGSVGKVTAPAAPAAAAAPPSGALYSAPLGSAVNVSQKVAGLPTVAYFPSRATVRYDTDGYLATEPTSQALYFRIPPSLGAGGVYRCGLTVAGGGPESGLSPQMIQIGIATFQGVDPANGLIYLGDYLAGDSMCVAALFEVYSFTLSVTVDGPGPFLPFGMTTGSYLALQTDPASIFIQKIN